MSEHDCVDIELIRLRNTVAVLKSKTRESLCHSAIDEDGMRHHIPGCWACAIDGHRHCTCDSPAARKADIKRLEYTEARLLRLEATA